MNKGHKQMFPKRRYPNSPQIHEQVFNSTNLQEMKSKPQIDKTSHLLDWLLSKS